jgi:hypothetical protein
VDMGMRKLRATSISHAVKLCVLCEVCVGVVSQNVICAQVCVRVAYDCEAFMAC